MAHTFCHIKTHLPPIEFGKVNVLLIRMIDQRQLYAWLTFSI
jgi:hypothetical protein